MNRQIETRIEITRNGIVDIPVDIIGDYCPPVFPFRDDPDDGPEVSVEKAYIAADVRDESGNIVFKCGEPICLTEKEDDAACEAILREAA